MSLERACIVGAGSSGLACAKVLAERGVPFDCFEMGSGLGGNWRYGNDNGVSSAYASLHINTSKQKMAYSDFPMPEEYPDFPHHTQVLAYFEDYARHFGLYERITFGTRVTEIEPAGEPGGWLVTTRGRDGALSTGLYGAVLVANGHHWQPRLPDFPGSFTGTVLHSHEYTTPEILDGRRVLVVGVGNSGCDIACEATGVAERVLLSTRRGAHVIPKYLLGRPLDLFLTPLGSRMPVAVQRLVYALIVFLTRGSQKKYGFPIPAHRLGEAHPTISQHLLPLVRDGVIQVKPNIKRLAGDRVVFEDGTEDPVDCIIYATGYNVSFPFLDDGLLRVEENRVPLFHHVVAPALPNLYFIGLVQPLGENDTPRGPVLLAVDTVGAGVHEKVLLVLDGKAAGDAMKKKAAPVDAAIVGIVDYVDVP